MKRHPFDLTSLLFGLVFGGAAAAYLAADQLEQAVDARWVLPTALIALGVASIAGALSGLRSRGGDTGTAGTGTADTGTAVGQAATSTSDELQPTGSDRGES